MAGFLNAFFGPATPGAAGAGILDPEAQRRQMIMQALLSASAAVGQQPTFGQGLAAGFQGAGQGALAGRQGYREQALQDYKLQQLTAEDEAKKKRDTLWASLFPAWGAPTSDMANNRPAIPFNQGMPPRPGTQFASAGGPTPGQPQIGANPMLAGMDPKQLQMLAMLGPEQGLPMLAEQAFAKPTESWSPMSPAQEIAQFGKDLPGSYYASSLGNAPKLVEGSAPDTLSPEAEQQKIRLAIAGRTPPAPVQPTDWDKKWALLEKQYPNGVPENIILQMAGAAPPETKAPTGYQWTGDGKLVPIQGGPSDPATISTIRGAGADAKPMGSEGAKFTALATQGIAAIDELKPLLFSEHDETTGTWSNLNRLTLTELQNIPLVGAPTMSADAQRIWTLAYEMADARLRLTTGAQAPEHEVRATAKAFLPNLFDHASVALGKLDDLRKYFNDYMQFQGQPSGAGATAQPGAQPAIPTYDPATGQWTGL